MGLPRVPDRMVVELSRPTILSFASVICYCLAMLFHIIAYTTNSWSTLTLNGVEWRMGLWYGCRHNATTDVWICSTDVFEDKVFKTGSNWHIGSQIMMTFALIIMFLLEFAVVGYACIKRLERHKSKVVGIVIALSVTAAFSHFLVLIMYGTEVGKVEDSFVEASFGVVIISMFLEILIPIFIRIDKEKRFPKQDALTAIRRELRRQPSKTEGMTKERGPPHKVDSVGSEEAEKSYRPRKLSAVELEKRFPPYTFDNYRYYPPSSTHSSRTSLAHGKGRTSSIGSARSLQTQSTAITGVSFDPKYSDRYSTDKSVQSLQTQSTAITGISYVDAEVYDAGVEYNPRLSDDSSDEEQTKA